jgi:hypothetical protein
MANAAVGAVCYRPRIAILSRVGQMWTSAAHRTSALHIASTAHSTSAGHEVCGLKVASSGLLRAQEGQTSS